MKKNLFSVIITMMLSVVVTLGAYAACNIEIGACRISDLQKITHVKSNDTNPLKGEKITSKTQPNLKKPSFKQFIESLLKP